MITGERSIGSGTRRIEALTGDRADEWLDTRLGVLQRTVELVGAQSIEAVRDRVASLQDELREARRRLRSGAGTGVPRPAELAAGASEIAPGVKLAAYGGPFESIDLMKAAAKDVRGALPSGVIALGLDADEPQLFVTVSDDLVARGISAGSLVQTAVPAIAGRGGGRPEMAQGKGSRREGLTEALDAIRVVLRNGSGGSSAGGSG